MFFSAPKAVHNEICKLSSKHILPDYCATGSSAQGRSDQTNVSHSEIYKHHFSEHLLCT